MKLQLTHAIVIIFTAAVIFWISSLVLAADRQARTIWGWKVVFLSFFGYAWLGFGCHYILRFLVLAYDPEFFRASLFPMWMIPSETLEQSWLYLIYFWGVFCMTYALVVNLLPPMMPSIIKKIHDLATPRQIPLLDKVTIILTFLLIIVNSSRFPSVLYTPFSILSSLYTIPITIIWYYHFDGYDVGKRRYVYFIPGIINYIFNPYREHLLTMALCVLVPAILKNRRISIKKFISVVIIFLLVSTVVTNTMRSYKWGGKNNAATVSGIEDRWEKWNEKPYTSPWVKVINRFHGFDSTALTFYAVPDIFPYSERNVIKETLTKAFIPRIILESKPTISHGRKFSQTIWALDESGKVRNKQSAPIAPSMIGDLYSINGVSMLIFGALLYGLFIGFLEHLKRYTNHVTSSVMLTLLAINVAAAFERDFCIVFSSIIQLVIVIVLVFSIYSYDYPKSRSLSSRKFNSMKNNVSL
jgi:hypothetical protein